jgi:hypothetical protein
MQKKNQIICLIKFLDKYLHFSSTIVNKKCVGENLHVWQFYED